MLTLADSRRIDGATVYRDVSWVDGSRALTTRFHVLPDAPVLATGDGTAGYTFYRYRGAAGTDVGGGLLVLAVELTAPDDAEAAVRTAYALPADAEILLGPVPVTSSAARLVVAGEGSSGEFVTSVTTTTDAGTGTVALVAGLTRDGAALLSQAMTATTAPGAGAVAPVHVEFDLAVEYGLDDLALTVWCDTSAAAAVAGDLAAAGRTGPGQLSTELIARHLAGSSLLTARALTPEEQTALDQLTNQILQSAVLPSLLDADGHPAPGRAAAGERSSLTLTASTTGVLNLTRAANLGLPDAEKNTVSSDLGADGLRRFVRVATAGDLGAYGIALIDVQLDYAGTCSDGTVLERTADLVLRAGAPAAAATFDIATADQRAVTAHVRVHLADGSAPYEFDVAPTSADAIDLDVDRLGVLAVDVQVSGLDLTTNGRAVVEFAYGAEGTGPTGTCVLDGSAPGGRWVAAVREVPTAYRYRVTWVQDGQRTVGEWESSTQAALHLVAPFTPSAATVTVVAAGEFDQLTAVVVELRAADDQPVTTLRLSTPGATATWSRPGGAGSYEYRTTLVRPDGSHRIEPMTTTDRPVLVVRDTQRYDVTVVGALLGLGPAVTKAVVELESIDPSAPIATVVLDATTTSARTAVRLVDPAVPGYRYRLTLRPSSGPALTGSWQSATSSVLVLRPPS